MDFSSSLLPFAEGWSAFAAEISLILSLMLTALGPLLLAYLPRHRMSVEERVKDSLMTETEARRQIRFFRFCAPVATLVGTALLVRTMFELLG